MGGLHVVGCQIESPLKCIYSQAVLWNVFVSTRIVYTQAQDFRRGALAVCEQAVAGRASSDTVAMRYYYPPNLLDYQPHVDQNDSEITVSVDYLSSDGTRCSTNIQAQNVVALECVYVANCCSLRWIL